MWILALLAACGEGRDAADTAPVTLGECDTVAPTVVGLLNQITFARADEHGVSNGFDLDGQVSSASDPDGCFIEDYVSPEGLPGVDNAFARLLPALELTEAQAVEPLIQETINSGQLLLFFELEDVDDLVDDSCVNLKLLRGSGAPVVGNGLIVSNQTFERDEETFASGVEGVAIRGGTVLAGPLTLELPITVFAVELTFVLRDAHIRVDLREDGTYWGYFAGGVLLEDLVAVAQEDTVDPELAGILETLLAVTADLAPDASGSCTEIAITLGFEGVSAFFYED